mgnify:CR=1 FL=1
MRTAADVQEANADASLGRDASTLSTPDLTGLSEAEKEVFVSCEIHGLRPSEVARSSGWSAATVRSLRSRAKEKRGEHR